MGNHLNKFCGGTGSHDEFNYMPVVKKQNGQFEQICQGWISVLKYDDKYYAAKEKRKAKRDGSENDGQEGQVENILERHEDDQKYEMEDEQPSIGTKYFGVLYSDRLKLFEDEELAYRHINKLGEDWEIKPKEEHMIYRLSKTGLISGSYKQQSFTIMVQDNVCKMQTLELKITVLNSDGEI